ncbi:MAG TPA: DUF3105 domain-containing protein [Thermomicrobiales bacterium]|nr:DUF3105 domain-containing protein [Thermomicrobiales bacterium]
MAQTTQKPSDPQRPSAAERRAARAAEIERARAQQRQRLLIVAAGAVVLLIIAGVFLARNVQQKQQTNQAAQALMARTKVPDEGRTHVNEGTPIDYKLYPPASGPHFPSPQPAGVYRQEVAMGYWVHSLEHGYVVVLLKCPSGCDDLFNQFQDLYEHGLPKSQFGNVKLVVTPYSHAFSDPGKEAPITLVAWDHEEMLQTFDRAKILEFYNTFVDKGPEQIP